MVKLLDEAVVYFPVVGGCGIFPVDIHAVKVIFFHECGYLICNLFPMGCHINIDSVVTVSPCAVGKCGYYELHAVALILTLGNYLFERGQFLRELFFAHLAEVHVAVFVPVNGGKDDNRAVHIIELRVASDIFVALGEYLRRNISVEPLISRYFKSLCVALGFIIKLERLYVCRHGVVAELVYREPYVVRGHLVKAAQAHILYLFALIHGFPFAVNKSLEPEILNLIADLFNQRGVYRAFGGEFYLRVAARGVVNAFGRGAVRALSCPALAAIIEHICGVRFFIFFQRLKNYLRAACGVRRGELSLNETVFLRRIVCNICNHSH